MLLLRRRRDQHNLAVPLEGNRDVAIPPRIFYVPAQPRQRRYKGPMSPREQAVQMDIYRGLVRAVDEYQEVVWFFAWLALVGEPHTVDAARPFRLHQNVVIVLFNPQEVPRLIAALAAVIAGCLIRAPAFHSGNRPQ